MKRVRQVVLGLVFTLQVAASGSALATPLATFATTAPAHDNINFPIENGVLYGSPFYVAGTLVVPDTDPHIFALGTHYLYEHSLLTYFDFLYSFIGDHGEFISDQLFRVLFDSSDDYVDVGRVPDGGMPYTYAFDGSEIARKFSETYHGLADNVWTIYGFRANVAHIYQPGTESIPDPGRCS